MTAGMSLADNGDDDTTSVNIAIGSDSSSSSNLAEPGPVPAEDENRGSSKSNQRRVSRSEKRYYTADSIQELRQQKEKDTTIHKRLSWQNENHMEEKLRKKVLSTDSVTSIPSSSGVSSTASLHLNPESDITEETEMQRSGSSRTLLEDSQDENSASMKAKSTPDIVTLFNALKTGEREDGISSVDLPPLDGEGSLRLTQAQLLKMKKQLLLNTDVEAS